MPVHSKKQVQVKVLLLNKASTEISVEYFDYNNIFLVENLAELLNNTTINKHAIKLEKGKQLLFGLIHSLRLVELETLKTYIEINLANSFIWPFKSPTRISIFFNRKPDKSFHFCIDYWSLNNIIIKN